MLGIGIRDHLSERVVSDPIDSTDFEPVDLLPARTTEVDHTVLTIADFRIEAHLLKKPPVVLILSNEGVPTTTIGVDVRVLGDLLRDLIDGSSPSVSGRMILLLLEAGVDVVLTKHRVSLAGTIAIPV